MNIIGRKLTQQAQLPPQLPQTDAKATEKENQVVPKETTSQTYYQLYNKYKEGNLTGADFIKEVKAMGVKVTTKHTPQGTVSSFDYN